MLSVVVPTHNRGRSITATIESLLSQDLESPYEVVVVDNNSTDDTAAVIDDLVQRNASKLRSVFEPEQGSSAARNAGIAGASGSIVAFVDDDVIAPPGWLEAMAHVFKTHADAWCVGGKVELSLPPDLPPWFEDVRSSMVATYLSRQDHGPETIRLDRTLLISANLAVTREALDRVGGFDTTLGRFGRQLLCGEDLDLVRRIYRAGGGVYYCGQAVVFHLIPPERLTKRYLRDRAFWEGRTRGRVAVRRNGVKRPAEFGREWLMMTKEWLMLWPYLAAGRTGRSFEFELSALKRFGYLREIALWKRR